MHSSIIGLVAGGLGVSIVPACMQNLQRRDVVYKRLSPATPRIATQLAWRAAPPSRVLDSFLAVCRRFGRARSRA
jgi:DNA-binding transcriptional LysR family regulator